MELGGEWIIWKRNPPVASNMGGVWERQIRSARSILSAMFKNHGESINFESLRTLLVKVEGIINSWPTTCESIDDLYSIIPLSPMQLLSSTTRVVMPPPGTFQKEDMYCGNQWRRVQHLEEHDGGRRYLKHFRLGRGGTRPNETSKEGIMFWYVVMLFETNGQWREYWKRTAMNKD